MNPLPYPIAYLLADAGVGEVEHGRLKPEDLAADIDGPAVQLTLTRRDRDRLLCLADYMWPGVWEDQFGPQVHTVDRETLSANIDVLRLAMWFYDGLGHWRADDDLPETFQLSWPAAVWRLLLTYWRNEAVVEAASSSANILRIVRGKGEGGEEGDREALAEARAYLAREIEAFEVCTGLLSQLADAEGHEAEHRTGQVAA